MNYFASLPGRALLAATGFFLIGPGLAAVLGTEGAALRAWAIFPLLGSVCAVISAGLGLYNFAKETTIFILYLPVMLWLCMPGFGVMAFEHEHRHAFARGQIVLVERPEAESALRRCGELRFVQHRQQFEEITLQLHQAVAGAEGMYRARRRL